jgi:hypothetical protein
MPVTHTYSDYDGDAESNSNSNGLTYKHSNTHCVANSDSDFHTNALRQWRDTKRGI